MNPPATDAEIRDWLLARLAEARVAELEEQLLADDELCERLRDEETMLLDDCARGRLTADERAAVQRRLLRTPGDRERLRVARALARVAGAAPRKSQQALQPSRRRRPPRFWMAGLAAALVATVAALLWQSNDGRTPGRPHVALNLSPKAPVISLLAHIQRGAAPLQVQIPDGAEAVRLQAEIETPRAGASYALDIADGHGRSRFAADGLQPRRAGDHTYVEAAVPSVAFAAGTVRVRLRDEGDAAASFDWTVSSGKAAD